MGVADGLSRPCKENPEIAQTLELYERSRHIYQEALRAMGRERTLMFESRNSADVTIEGGRYSRYRASKGGF